MQGSGQMLAKLEVLLCGATPTALVATIEVHPRAVLLAFSSEHNDVERVCATNSEGWGSQANTLPRAQGRVLLFTNTHASRTVPRHRFVLSTTFMSWPAWNDG